MSHSPLDALGSAACPGCGSAAGLSSGGAPAERRCSACGGSFLDRDAAYRLFVEELGVTGAAIGQLLTHPGPRSLECPACGAGTAAIVVAGADVDLCPGCGAAWLGPSARARLPGGGGPPAKSPFGPPPSPFGPPPGVAPAPVSGVALALPAEVPLELERSRPEVPGPRTAVGARSPAPRASSEKLRPVAGTKGALAAGRSKPPLALLAAAGAALLLVLVVAVALWPGGEGEGEGQAPLAEGDLIERYGAYLRHYRFGGRSVDWWSERLSELAPGGARENATLFSITKKRAERLGLVVERKPEGVFVSLSEPLAARLLERLEVK